MHLSKRAVLTNLLFSVLCSCAGGNRFEQLLAARRAKIEAVEDSDSSESDGDWS
jgi:hypothetical protein